MNTKRKLSRREMIKLVGLGAAGATLAACAPQTVTVIVTQQVQVEKKVEVTKEVEKVVTKEVNKLVTPTPVKGITNSAGTELPPDAVSLDKQFILNAVGITGGGFGHIMESLYNRAFEHAGGTETLTTLNTDLETIPVGCESWKQSDDGLSWDFILRKGLVFNDGSLITAKDWEYTLKWSLSRGYDFGFFYLDIKNAADVLAKKKPQDELGIKAIDDFTLRITTEKITPYTPSLGTWFELAKAGSWEAAGENWALDPKRYISSGPFTLSEFERGVKDTWVLNPKYKGIRKTYINEIRERTLPTGIAAYMAGDLQTYSVSGATPPAERALVNANPVLRGESHPQPATYTDYLGFNTLKGKFPPLDNPDVRMALCKAIDKETLVAQIWQGMANPAWGILPTGFPGYSGNKLKDLDPNKYDPEAAKQLLSKAGFPGGKGFPKFELWIRQPVPIQVALCQAIQARWKENLGIEVDLKPADFQAFAEVYKGKGEKAPIYHVSYSLDYQDPATFFNVFKNDGRHPHDGAAWTDAYEKANYGKKTTAERFTQLAEVEKMLVEGLGYYFLHSPFSISMWPCNAAGAALDPNKSGFSFWGGGGAGSPHSYEETYWTNATCRAGVSG
jgi:oligopeptide transport system substrate-binding protein